MAVKNLILILYLLINIVTVIYSKIAIDPTREQLITDALNWMTFRKNGQLMTPDELEPLFLDSLMQKYTTSKYYRTFVIAFQHGVLPRLTLNENDACDPAYTSEYKHPFNNSVTWYYQKQFTFKSYDDVTSGSSGRQYCDYRQGLICNPGKKTCQCPDGTKMGPIDPAASPQVKRCLFQDNEICSLIDIDHGSTKPLAKNLYHMIFNLEKPPSCKAGTQCRYKASALDFPRCHRTGPFTDTVTPKFGEECTLGLIAVPGTCAVEGRSGGLSLLSGYTCYNFGPPNSIKSSNPHAEMRTGFCAHDEGHYGITSSIGYDGPKKRWDVMINHYLHPRLIPLRGQELFDFWNKILSSYFHSLYSSAYKGVKVGDKCTVSKTKKMEDVWQYFMDLKNIPAAQDYATGATKALLDANLQEATDLMTSKGDVCKIFWNTRSPYKSFKCVPDSSTDADGNDGKCDEPGTLNTKPDADAFTTFLRQYNDANVELIMEESIYRKELLLTYPEPPCLPALGPLPPQQLSSRNNPDTLEGGYCPADSVCYMDFSDAHGHYDSKCNLKSTKQLLICHDSLGTLEKCEKEFMVEKVRDAMEDLSQYGKRDKGEACYYAFEKALREKDEIALASTSPYQIMNWIERDVLCDMTGKNLECTSNGICETIVPKPPVINPPGVTPVPGGGGKGGDNGTGTGPPTRAASAQLKSGIFQVLVVVFSSINLIILN